MSGRVLWFVAGASAGLYASVRARRMAARFTPVGVADQLGALSVGLRAFSDEVQVGMAVREGEIARQLGLAARAPRPALAEQEHLPPRALAAPAPAR